MKYFCWQFQQFSHCKLDPCRNANQGVHKWASLLSLEFGQEADRAWSFTAVKGQVLLPGTWGCALPARRPLSPGQSAVGTPELIPFSGASLGSAGDPHPVGHCCLPSGQTVHFPSSFIFSLPISGSILFCKTCHILPSAPSFTWSVALQHFEATLLLWLSCSSGASETLWAISTFFR